MLPIDPFSSPSAVLVLCISFPLEIICTIIESKSSLIDGTSSNILKSPKDKPDVKSGTGWAKGSERTTWNIKKFNKNQAKKKKYQEVVIQTMSNLVVKMLESDQTQTNEFKNSVL